MNIQPILIMSAMEMESDILLNKIQINKTEYIGKYAFYEGVLDNYPIVLCLTRVNTRNAAVATYIAIEKYNPIAIINQGTAGGHGKIVHRGDIVLCKECFNNVSGISPVKKEGEGSDSLSWDLVSFNTDIWHNFELISCDSYLIQIAEKIENKYGKLYTGRIASGDFWNREADKILFLNNKFNSIGEDMECIAIYNIAHDFSIPVLGIKVISNNEILGECFDKDIAKVSQEFTYNFLIELIKNMK